jgi:ABC-type multidrug transport system ATPase subunit
MRLLELQERKDVRVSSLSGGQRKRVSVGVELLSKPRLLFADEPTSGLDPALERSMTENFRKLADDGHMVIVTTHIMSSLSLYNSLVVLVGGRLAYFGPPQKIKAYFGVDDFAEIYTVLGQKPAREWSEKFQQHQGKVT